MNEEDAVESLERLGLTSYEAKVFIALQKLGGGTARDVHRITDVPRSQVYSVAENLADRGLVEVQQSNPIRYRPVDVEEARSTLRSRFEREQEQAFDYVESVRRSHADDAEQREAIWTVRGSDHVDDRIVELLRAADERAVLGTRRLDLVTPEIQAALREAADRGLSVVVVSENPDVRELFDDATGVTTVEPPASFSGDEDPTGRVAFADDDRLLFSVVGGDLAGDFRETAIRSADTNFASVLIRILESTLQLESVS